MSNGETGPIGATGATGPAGPIIPHGSLIDMPDSVGLNTDHDMRYVTKVQDDEPTIPTPQFIGELWYDKDAVQDIPEGPAGPTGPRGLTGPVGYGTQGLTGARGLTGPSGSGRDEKVKVSSIDTVAAYLDQKLLAGTGIVLAKGNTGANETLTVSLYVAPSVSLSGGSTVEIGSTIVNVNLNWVCNKSMLTRLLSAPVPSGDRNRGPGGSGSYTHLGANLVSNTTYSITVGDGVSTAVGSTTCSFLNRRYYGTNIGTGPLSNAQILALNKEFCSGRSNTHTYNCSGGTYIWICYPARFGLATFRVSGLEVTFTRFTQDVTNNSGYTESFYCYRSTEFQHGSDIEVVVT